MRTDLHKYYTALGLTPGATAFEIKRAYRQLIQRWHPDHFKAGSIMQTTAEDTTKELNEAYEQLYKKQLYKKFPAKMDDGAEDEEVKKPAPRARKAYRYEPPPPPEPVHREKSAAEPPPQAKKKAAPPKRRPSEAAATKAAWPAAFQRVPWIKLAAAVAVIAAGVAFWPAATPKPVPPMIREPLSATVQTETLRSPTAAPAAPVTSKVARAVAVKSTDHTSSGRPAVAGVALPASVSVTAPDLTIKTASVELASALVPVQDAGRSPPMPSPVTYAAAYPHSGTNHGDLAGATLTGSQDEAPVREPARTVLVSATEWSRLLDQAEALIDTFEPGDNKLKVLALQGSPDESRENVFRYGSSLVYFKDGVVTGWADGLPRLRVRAHAEVGFGLLDRFRPGSSRLEVFRAQGQPTALVPGGYYYGASAVFFENDRVTHWIERDQALRTSPVPSLPFENLSRPAGR